MQPPSIRCKTGEEQMQPAQNLWFASNRQPHATRVLPLDSQETLGDGNRIAGR